ncbi:MFS transporter [Geodermatophilus sabuli]|uniref:Drug resistance transporter, EmrB/QacA subfamily n=1 Tax=Geodermatophilus sabuli TaxID=1564158 RepID=A0A285E844_9ACTN|nr:MFS transporter [Geodermatophilus sabuli]MBB3082859.1 EmrB/QacA subfamily drug resistance transporter [Geodermatophilus sabuli]SNX94276.1 drug resistance transporter, EmrB/QacA subfamily [Geodermatophilus sabuli]
MAGSPVAQPVHLGSARGRWLLLATVLASGMAFLDATAVTVALPAIGRELGASLAELQWTVTGYTLALAALVLLGGALGDRYGRRRVFLVGVGWFAAASLVCGLAASPGQLVAARVLQGVGGALLTPGSLALVQASFRPADRARAIGLWSAFAGIAGLVGPFLGGLLVDAASWRLVFLLNVPVAAAVLLVAGRHVPESRDESHRGRFDVPGAALGALALGAVTHALIAAGEQPGRPDVVAAGVLGVVAGAGFVVRERRARHPLLPPSLFAERQFTGANLATFAVYGGLGGSSLFLVLQLQLVLGYDAAAAGAAMLPSIALITLLSPAAGSLAMRTGPRLPMTVGPLLTAAGTAWLAGVDAGSAYLTAVLPGSLLQGLGMATTVAPLTATVLAAAPDALAGVASGVNNAVARAAQLLAVATLPVAVGLSGADYARPEVFAAGYRTAMLACAGLFVVGAAVSLATIRDDVLRT